MTCRANLSYSEEFQLPAAYPERAAEYSRPRRENMVKFFAEDPSTNDDAKARAYLNKELNVDGTVSDGSTTFLNNLMGLDSWTAYQTVTKPDERKIWWRIPTLGPRQEIDLKKYFTNSQPQ